MSDIGLALSNADAVLKDFYLPGMRSILNNEIFLLTQVETNTDDIEGRDAVISINVGRNHGVGARAELGTLPNPGRQSYAEQRVRTKYNYASIQVSGPSLKAMASDQGSFVRPLQSETTGAVRDLKNDVARQTYADGTGAIATVTSNSGAVVTLTSPSEATMYQLEDGMNIDIGTTANPTASGSAQIVAVDVDAGTVTLDSTVSVTSGHKIFREGSGGTGVNQKEITGLAAQVSDSGALWGIDPADVPKWVSYVNSSAGAVSEDMYIAAAQRVNQRSGEDIDLWVTTAAVHRATANLLTSLKQFPNTTTLKGGYTGIDMSSVSQGNTGPNTVSMVWDKDMVEEGAAYGLTTSRIQCYAMSDWEWMQEDGSILSRINRTDAYEATLFRYMELATDGRNAHCKLEGITGI